MKYYSIFLFSILIIFVLAPIPNWEFDGQSISLLDYEETIYENSGYETYVKLRKVITNENGVVSNKNKLTVGTSSEREVNFEDAKKYAEDNGYKYFETSAKSGKGINESIRFLVQEIIDCHDKKNNVHNNYNEKKNK